MGSASALSAPTQALGPVYPVIEIDLLSIIKPKMPLLVFMTIKPY